MCLCSNVESVYAPDLLLYNCSECISVSTIGRLEGCLPIVFGNRIRTTFGLQYTKCSCWYHACWFQCVIYFEAVHICRVRNLHFCMQLNFLSVLVLEFRQVICVKKACIDVLPDVLLRYCKHRGFS